MPQRIKKGLKEISERNVLCEGQERFDREGFRRGPKINILCEVQEIPLKYSLYTCLKTAERCPLLIF